MATKYYLNDHGLVTYNELIKRTISELINFDVSILDELPDTGVEHILYLIPSKSELEKNIHDEYLWVDENWEMIGNTTIDLDNYYTKDEVNASLAEKANVFNIGANLDLRNNYLSAIGYTYNERNHSFVEGYNESTADGWASHAEGYNNEASGEKSHTEGNSVVANGQISHAEGDGVIASGWTSHAEGVHTISGSWASHAEGAYTETTNDAEHAQGQYNKSNNKTIHSIGIGYDAEHRKNALEVLNDGKVFVNNIGNYDGTSIENVSSLQEIINSKQEVITDLSEIRANATTAVQPTQISNFITADALQPYATIELVDAKLANKVDNSELENYYNKEFIDALVFRISELEQTLILNKFNELENYN